MQIRGTEIAGSIPNSVCQPQRGQISVDFCRKMVFSCCGCPTASPSGRTTQRALPSIIPSLALQPTVTFACSQFSPIAYTGSLLVFEQQDWGEESTKVAVRFAFMWRSLVPYSNVSVIRSLALYLENAGGGGIYRCRRHLRCNS